MYEKTDVQEEFKLAEGMTQRQRRAIETKNRIYAAAVAEITKKGINNVSIEDITSAANVAKGTFYTHFESKEALVYYTFEQSDAYYQHAYEQVKDMEFLFQITCFVHISYLEYEKRGKGIIKALVSNYFSVPERNYYRKDRNLLRCLSKIVEHGKEEGVLRRDRPTDHYVDILLSTLVGVEIMWCFDEQGRKLADMMEEAIGITAKGMMARSGGDGPGQTEI